MFDRTLQPPSERETPVSMTRAFHLAWLPLSLAIRRKFNAMPTPIGPTTLSGSAAQTPSRAGVLAGEDPATARRMTVLAPAPRMRA